MSSAVRRVQESPSASYQVLMELTRSDLISRGDVQGAARMITEMTLAVLRLGRASVWLFESANDERDLVAVDFYEPDTHQSGIRFPERLCPNYCRYLDDHRLLAIEDAIHDDVTRELAEVYLIPSGITAVLDAPIYEDGKAVGVVCQAHKGGTRAWTDEERFFAAALADIMSITIANRRKRETMQELTALEHRHELAVQAGEVGVWSWDVTTKSFWANDQFWMMLNQDTPQALPFEVLRAGLSAREVAKLKNAFEAVEAGRSHHVSLEQCWESPKRLRWLLTKGQSMTTEKGMVIMGTTIDITERKLAEEAQQRILESERSAQQIKDRFLGNMSHELRTPLNGILGMSELLKMSNLNKEQNDFADTILVCGRMLLSTFNNMLDITKIEAKKMSIYPVECRVYGIISQVKQVLLAKSMSKDITLMIDDKTENGMMKTDEHRLIQVLIALTDNAIKFSPRDRMIIMRAMFHEEGTRTMLVVDIQDQGPGISPVVRDRLFTPFATHDDSMTRNHEGTGLGLAIAKGLMHLLGGDVSVLKTGPEGTTMRVEALGMAW